VQPLKYGTVQHFKKSKLYHRTRGAAAIGRCSGAQLTRER
jgi:hypothetical protein